MKTDRRGWCKFYAFQNKISGKRISKSFHKQPFLIFVKAGLNWKVKFKSFQKGDLTSTHHCFPVPFTWFILKQTRRKTLKSEVRLSAHFGLVEVLSRISCSFFPLYKDWTLWKKHQPKAQKKAMASTGKDLAKLMYECIPWKRFWTPSQIDRPLRF